MQILFARLSTSPMVSADGIPPMHTSPRLQKVATEQTSEREKNESVMISRVRVNWNLKGLLRSKTVMDSVF